MLEFYEFNTLNISIVLISTFIIYYILSNWFSNKKQNKDGENELESKFSFEFLIIAALISICISLIISYIMAGKDESILTDNYWDPMNEGPVGSEGL